MEVAGGWWVKGSLFGWILDSLTALKMAAAKGTGSGKGKKRSTKAKSKSKAKAKEFAMAGTAIPVMSASTVSDPDGPSPAAKSSPIEEIDIDDIPEMHYDPAAHPVPHQPWRRGNTDGCHDPINSPWRVEAHRCIEDAVRLVGAELYDVTWYMAKCVVSIDEQSLSSVVSYTEGPEVQIEYPDEDDVGGHVWEDPDAGTEREYVTEEDELLDMEQYDEDTEFEILKANAVPEEDDDDDEAYDEDDLEYDEATGEFRKPDPEIRTRAERMMEMHDEAKSQDLGEPRDEKPDDGSFAHPVDPLALSTVSSAIMAALSNEDLEDRLQILSRHDLILTSPLGDPVVLDSQKEFDEARGLDVYVETRDPWNSNRILGGKLVDRDAMDVIINQDNSGRLVTIPNSMIHQVLKPSGLAEVGNRVARNGDGDEDEDSLDVGLGGNFSGDDGAGEEDEEEYEVEEEEFEEEVFE